MTPQVWCGSMAKSAHPDLVRLTPLPRERVVRVEVNGFNNQADGVARTTRPSQRPCAGVAVG